MIMALRPDKDYWLECYKGRMELGTKTEHFPWVLYYKGSASFIAQKGKYFYEPWIRLEI